MIDYKIGLDGTVVAMISERALQRGTGPKSQQGSSIVFRTRRDTAQFVYAGEAAGYVFEGKENIADAFSVGA